MLGFKGFVEKGKQDAFFNKKLFIRLKSPKVSANNSISCDWNLGKEILPKKFFFKDFTSDKKITVFRLRFVSKSRISL